MLTLTIVGRPNVGKSTLFNRLYGKQHALTHDKPGVTRDVREVEITISDTKFMLRDTAGLDEVDGDDLAARMSARALDACRDADINLFVIDGRAGVIAGDQEIAAELRKLNRPVILLVNKAEGSAADNTMLEAYGLGFGEPIAISASHGHGMYELAQAVFEQGEEACEDESEDDLEDDLDESDEDEDKAIQIAIVGRPNAGKSTFINALLKEDRVLTGPEAGITRDAISIPFEYDGQAMKLVDTAGMRRKANVKEALESMAVGDTLRSIQYAHVVVLMVDATQPLEEQDLTIADLCEREGRALVIACNKWDLVEEKDQVFDDIEHRVATHLAQVKGVPILRLSSLNGKNIEKVLDASLEMYRLWNKRMSTAELNRWLNYALAKHSPPTVSKRRLKIRYLTQTKTRPPTFYLSSNMKEIPEHYLRYLVNELRNDFGLDGVPIRMMVRPGKNPYEGRKSKPKPRKY